MIYLTEHQARQHLSQYGTIRHNVSRLIYAARQTAKQYNSKPIDIFFFMIENKKVNGMFLFEYGFNNSKGRQVKDVFASYYKDNQSHFELDEEGNNIIS
jgi:peptidyl-tRNA hydrolase